MKSITWEQAIKHGIFAALFIMLLLYTITDSRAREREYQATIDTVIEANSKYADIIKIDLARIESAIERR